MRRLGAHMSISGGMPTAVERARSVDAGALQVFVKSSNQWAARAFAAGEADAFRRSVRDAGLDRHTVAHASYLINLATPDPTLWARSRDALRVEVERCADLGIPALVVHPGSPRDSGAEAGIVRVARALDEVLAAPARRGGDATGSVRVLLETTAGQGATLGARFEELAAILGRSKAAERLGVCLDTCHAFAAGYDLRDARSYGETLGELDRLVGLDRLGALHLNDSKTPFASRVDRHTHIGRGHVGLEAFRLILADPRLADLPMILETPKGDDLAEDRENLATLRSLAPR